MQPIIITGGPGAGKTALLEAVARKGYLVFPETSRQLIREQQQCAAGVLPWTDLPAFAGLCLTAMSEQRRQAAEGTMPAFVDRAIGDICAYLTIGGEPVPANYRQAALGYYPSVFCCPPRREIYVQDNERPHSFAEAEQIHQQLVETYQALGYQVVDVPWGAVADRASWVLARIRLI
ncbi:AAA family ATPase [Photobacterium atrarenae]|uniref:AAA family ATPase n=1 Tax=Photobacterium atrarenae TaxID=865757 RepID=A0ABY5GEW6_9GAMM|nr:AAA family ATPase [Photobacterium atrarenae]UTV27644.1 AAA family ATPase [Photobacterium atrarenae]